VHIAAWIKRLKRKINCGEGRRLKAGKSVYYSNMAKLVLRKILPEVFKSDAISILASLSRYTYL